MKIILALILSSHIYAQVEILKCKVLMGGQTLESVEAVEFKDMKFMLSDQRFSGCYESVVTQIQKKGFVLRLDNFDKKKCVYRNLKSQYGVICQK